MDDGDLHEKRYIVLHVGADETRACVINSSVSHFIQSRPKLLQCQVAMSAAAHGFMDHDSYVDGSRTWIYDTESVVEELMNHTDWILGMATADLCDRLITAFRRSPNLSVADVEFLTESLRPIAS